MKVLAIFLLLCAFVGNATASAFALPHACCDSEECPMVQCIEMACLSAPAPALNGQAQGMRLAKSGSVAIAFLAADLPLVVNEVWTPPD